MADPKTVAGGVVVVAIGGGGGYLASKQLSENGSSSQQDAPLYSVTDLQEGKLGKALETAKFELLSPTQDKDSEWNALVAANSTTSSSVTKEQLQESCKNLIAENYSSGTTATENYKNAVKKCTKLATFAERAERLSIEIAASEDSDWNTRKDSLTTEVVSKTSVTGIEVTSSSASTEDKAKSFCQKAGELKWTTISTTGNKHTLEVEWKNYLTVCVKGTAVNKDFWTGATVTTASGN